MLIFLLKKFEPRVKKEERRGREYLGKLEYERKNKFLKELEASDLEDVDDPDWEDLTLKKLGIKITRARCHSHS